MALVDRNDMLEEEYSTARQVMYMLHDLQNMGYQKLRFMAFLSEGTAFWRCFIGPVWNFRDNGIIPETLDTDSLAFHSSGNGTEFFLWRDAKEDSPKQLADKFISRFPRISEKGRGIDQVYTEWFNKVIEVVKHGALPYVEGEDPININFVNYRDYTMPLPTLNRE